MTNQCKPLFSTMADLMPVEACGQMVEAANRCCQQTPSAPHISASPNWDAMAVSFASLSNAFAWGSIILAVVAILGAIAWGKVVIATAKQEARDAAEREALAMAKSCADDYIKKWLAEDAPGIIREHTDMLLDATLGSGDDAQAADDLGKEAG